jgi:hypothetical protein
MCGFAQAHNGTIAVAFEDVADGFVEHGALGAIHVAIGLLFLHCGGFGFFG